MKKLLTLFFLLIVLTSMASADSNIGFFKFGNSIQLTQICDNCTFVNLTKVVFPNGSFSLLGQYAMTKNGTNYNYSYSQSNTSGDYFYTTCGDLNGITTCQNTGFSVNNAGSELTIGRAVIYFIFFLFLFFLFLVDLVFISKFPKGNQKDESGVVTVVNMKYLTMALVYIAWLFIFAMLFIASNLAMTYLGEQLFSSYLFMLFRISFVLTTIATLLWFFWIIVNVVNDKQIKNMLGRGLPGSGKPGMSKY